MEIVYERLWKLTLFIDCTDEKYFKFKTQEDVFIRTHIDSDVEAARDKALQIAKAEGKQNVRIYKYECLGTIANCSI